MSRRAFFTRPKHYQLNFSPWSLTTTVLSQPRTGQVCVRSWLRNMELYKNVIGVFEAARGGDIRDVTRHVINSPHLLYIRDRYGGSRSSSLNGDVAEGRDGVSSSPPPCYSTLLHAACEVRRNCLRVSSSRQNSRTGTGCTGGP